MKIQIKEMVEDGSELLVYLLDDNSNPLIADIIPKGEVINKMHQLIRDYKITDVIERIKYEDYIKNI